MTIGTVRPVREILAATDFSDASDIAVRVAHAHARAVGARLHVFHVTWPDEPGVARLLGDTIDELGETVPAVAALYSGDAASEIVRYATAHDVGLIVVGTHGRTGFSRLLLGSVAERVARTAPYPVLVVPAEWRIEGDDRDPAPTVQRCVVCAQESAELICELCRAHIRGEALVAKRREEHGAHC